MRRAAGRVMLAAGFSRVAAVVTPTLSAASRFSSAALGAVASGATTTFTSGAITVVAGETLVISATTGTQTLYASAIALSGNTGAATRQVFTQPASSCPATLWTVPVTASGTVTITITLSASSATTANQYADCVVERWANASVASPVVVGAALAAGTTQSTTITPSNAASALTWFLNDYNATSPAGTQTYLNNATQAIAPYFQATILGVYSGTQLAVATTAQTIGITSTVTQKDTIAAIELKPAGS